VALTKSNLALRHSDREKTTRGRETTRECLSNQTAVAAGWLQIRLLKWKTAIGRAKENRSSCSLVIIGGPHRRAVVALFGGQNVLRYARVSSWAARGWRRGSSPSWAQFGMGILGCTVMSAERRAGERSPQDGRRALSCAGTAQFLFARLWENLLQTAGTLRVRYAAGDVEGAFSSSWWRNSVGKLGRFPRLRFRKNVTKTYYVGAAKRADLAAAGSTLHWRAVIVTLEEVWAIMNGRAG